MELLQPRVVAPAPTLPSYVYLDMAFGVGAGTTLYDKSRYRSHGTITGASWAAGLHGYSLDFNPAIPDYVVISADYTQLDFTSEKFSLIARVYIDDLSAHRTLMMRGAAGVSGWYSYIHSTGKLVVSTNQAAAIQNSMSTVGGIAAGAWYTLGFSRDGASILIYVNGSEDTPTAGVHIDPTTSAIDATIGVRNDLATQPYDGHMEFLRIFGGVALAASEHKAWHNALA